VLIAGGIDLSVTSTIALASMAGAMAMSAPHGRGSRFGSPTTALSFSMPIRTCTR
jgi:ribose/xylose/arabinose/galactoside ABC-type transport system permease subunit